MKPARFWYQQFCFSAPPGGEVGQNRRDESNLKLIRRIQSDAKKQRKNSYKTMKKLTSNIGVAALMLATVLFTGCSTLESDISTWLNSPSTQAEITAIETAATSFAEQYLISLIPAATPNPGVAAPITIDDARIVAAEAAEVATLRAKYPDAPKEAIQTFVHNGFEAALANQGAKR
jgi:hypothetical protein